MIVQEIRKPILKEIQFSYEAKNCFEINTLKKYGVIKCFYNFLVKTIIDVQTSIICKI